MPHYIVTLADNEIQELKLLIQKGGKGYRIKHAQILLKLDQKPENKAWTYDRIKEAYGASRNTIAGIAKRYVMEGMEAALGRKEQKNRYRKVTIHLFRMSRFTRDTGFFYQLLVRFVYADNRAQRVIGTLVNLQHILHFCHEISISLRDAPFLHKPRFDFVFFMTSQMVLSVM